MLNRWRRTRPELFLRVVMLLYPDESLYGHAKARTLAPGSVIVLKDKPKRNTQVTLHRYFKIKPKKQHGPVQTSLHRFFKAKP